MKDDNQCSEGLNMKEYFKTKRESKTITIEKCDISNNEDSLTINHEEKNEIILGKKNFDLKIDEHEINNIPQKKKKRESKLCNETDTLVSNNCYNVEVKKKKVKALATEIVDNVENSKKNKEKLLHLENVDNIIKKNSNESIMKDNKKTQKEPHSELVLTHKYQHLVDLLIENSSAGKKFCNNLPTPLFDKKMKEFVDDVKHQYTTTVCFNEPKSTDEESASYKSITLNPDDKNFIRDFEAQKLKVLETITKQQEVAKYVNEKSMFIAKHGHVLFFGSNINDIKGYGDW